MISKIPEITWVYNNDDELPIEGVDDGQFAINKDTGECVVFDLPSKTWKKL